MFIGRRFFPPGQKDFNSGGAGYLLDKAALRHLAANIDSNPKCFPHQHGFWEDVNVANCLRNGEKGYTCSQTLGADSLLAYSGTAVALTLTINTHNKNSITQII